MRRGRFLPFVVAVRYASDGMIKLRSSPFARGLLGRSRYTAWQELESMVTEVQDKTREVTVSSNRQVGLVSDFARRMGIGPRSRLLETLVRLPGGGYAVLLMRRPTSFTALLVDALAPSGGGGVRFLRKHRDEWSHEKPVKRKAAARTR
jgi:hypothetical protein